MIAEPLTVTVSGTPIALMKINQDNYSSEWFLRTAGGEFRAFVRNSSFKDRARAVMVDRHNVELRQTIFGVSPAPDTVYKTYFVMEVDRGTALIDSISLASGLFTRAQASSNALLNQIGGNES